MKIDPTNRESLLPSRVGALAFTKQALRELLGLPPGCAITDVFVDRDCLDIIRFRIEGPQMPLHWPGHVIMHLNATVERTPEGQYRCEIHGLNEH